MTDTPIGDAVAADLGIAGVEDETAPDPGAYEPAADADPPPLLNDDADDPLDDVEEGEDDGDTDLDDDDDQGEEVAGNGE